MTSNQTMVHHVRYQHLYSRDGTYTIYGSCRRPQSMVEFHICYFFDHDSIYDISALLTKVQCTLFMNQISSLSMETVLHCILYMAMTTHDICLLCLFMAIVLICIRDFYIYFISTVMCRDLSLYYTDDWLDIPLGSSLLHSWDFYNVFQLSCTPLT